MHRPTDPELPSILQKRFTDRQSHIDVFRRYMDSVSAPFPALMFFGMGGVGKSWLLRKLRLEMTGLLAAPSVMIDYTREQGSNAYILDPLLFLAELRKITEAPCPRFDVAFALALVRRYQQDESALADKWKTTSLSAGWEIVKAWGGVVNPVLGGALAVLEKGYDAIKDLAFLSALREKFVQDLAGLQFRDLPAVESELTWRLCQDLREPEAFPLRPGLRAAQAVVFVDTLEALIPAGLSQIEEERVSGRLRELIGELRGRVLFVMAGQNRLDWSFLDPVWEDPAWIEQHLLEGLAEWDARDFLTLCGLAGADVQAAILGKCLRVKSEGYHPASLGLFADIGWLEMKRNGRPAKAELYGEVDRGDMASLVRRFLKSLSSEAEQQWIRRLAVTPSFDESAARAMHSDGWSQAQETAWEMLKGLSFLVPATSKPGWFAIHSSIQDALLLSGQTEQGWHERWRGYWEQHGQAGLAWFHFWHLDRKAARDAWRSQVKRSRAELAMTRHMELLSWWDLTGIADRRPKNAQDAADLSALGLELWRASLGDRAANLRQAIGCYEHALNVYTRAAFPDDWATTQNNLGNAWSDLPVGDLGANLRRAIACYELAVEVHTREAFPNKWAMTQNNLGLAYWSLPDSDGDTNLRRAIACYERALKVRTRDAFPVDWAMTQNNLGNAYSDLQDGDRGDNLDQAITGYKHALEVYTREAFPIDWAMTQNNLGLAYADLKDGDRDANLDQAITCYKCALEVYTREAFPADWAMTQNNLGLVYARLSGGDRAANFLRSIAYYQCALEVHTREAFPVDWARAQYNLGNAFFKRTDGDRSSNLRQAITRYEHALEVYTLDDCPADWAATQYNRGISYRNLPDGDRSANLRQAITCYECALQVYTQEAFPVDWAITQNSLGVAYSELPDGDRIANLRESIAFYERAVEMYTREGLLSERERTQKNLAHARCDLQEATKGTPEPPPSQ